MFFCGNHQVIIIIPVYFVLRKNLTYSAKKATFYNYCSSCTTINYVELFLKYLSLCLFQSDSHTSFLRAARAGNIDKVLEFLKGGVDIGTSNQVRDTSHTVTHYTHSHLAQYGQNVSDPKP